MVHPPPKLVFLGYQDEILNHSHSALHKFTRVFRRQEICLNGIKLPLKEHLKKASLLRRLDCAK